MRLLVKTVAMPALLGLLAAPAGAQMNIERFASSNFNFTPPGARSVALGGAFVAVADDATAVEANPAGLTVLLYPQASFEFKAVRTTNTVRPEAGGGFDGRSFEADAVFPSFASLVYPVGPVTFAASYAKIVDSSGDLFGNGFMYDDGAYLYPWVSTQDWDVANYGLGAAIKFGEILSIGVAGGVSESRLDMEHTRYEANEPAEGFVMNRVTIFQEDGTNTSPYINAGAILRVGSVSIGAVYKRRPEFKDLPVDFREGSGTRFIGYDSIFNIKLPDAIGGGIAVRATDRLTLTSAVEHVRYSQLAGRTAIVTAFNDTATQKPEFYRADDGLDIRGGLEFLLTTGAVPLALRVGVAQLAPSNIYYTGARVATQGLFGTEAGSTTMEYTAGFGGVLLRHLQIDVAGAYSDRRKELITSFVLMK